MKLNRTIQRFAEAGLKCIITELDMGVPSTSSANLEEQARMYRMITDIVLNNDNCPSMLIWGIKDNDSWRSSSNPLLYDSGLGCKPAWYAVRSALRHRAIVNGTLGIDATTLHPSLITQQPIYDLQGRRIESSLSESVSLRTKLKPGLYVSKGSKWVVR